jgi:hypothetical protein
MMTEFRGSKRLRSQTNTASCDESEEAEYTSIVAHNATPTADDASTITDGVASGGSSVVHKALHRRRKGLLARLTEFPLDVLLEVCLSLIRP